MERNVVDEVGGSLHLPHRRKQAIARELRSHLEESRRELELAGLDPHEAALESVNRFGDPKEIISGFERAYRPSRRAQLGLAFVLASGMILGVYGVGGTLASATTARHQTPAHHVTKAALHRPHSHHR
ncbi:MAG TPA: permease prefix domain 1-containing protein [Chloroflexota bacterium]|nr:permease prefix domain 1-containing protein [Chloroflexota bacterium]